MDDKLLKLVEEKGKLHLGCGETYKNGYVNIDFSSSDHTVQQNSVADYTCDIWEMQLPDGCVDEITSHHFFEHFERWKAIVLLIRWNKWLRVGGMLLIETPDFELTAQEFINTNNYELKERCLRHLYGSQEAHWANHLEGWYSSKFEYILRKLGFSIKNINRYSYFEVLYNIVTVAVKEKDSDINFLNLTDILEKYAVDKSPNEMKMVSMFYSMIRGVL